MAPFFPRFGDRIAFEIISKQQFTVFPIPLDAYPLLDGF